MSETSEIIPSISVLMSVFNGEKYLPKAIESILTQTYQDFEFVIINDGSTDRSAEIIISYPDPRIRYFEQINLGLSKSLNAGIGLCRGKYIARMDADDIALPRRLQLQVDFLEKNPKIAIVGTAAFFIKEDESSWYTLQYPCSKIEIRWKLLFCSPFVHSSVMLRSQALKQVGAYSQDERFSYVEDFELWSRIVQNFEGANLPAALLKYRFNPSGISLSKNDIQEQQSTLVCSQNISRLLGKELNSEDAKIIRSLYYGNALNWDYGINTMKTALELINEIYAKFLIDYHPELIDNPFAKNMHQFEMIRMHFTAASFYLINFQYSAAIRTLQEVGNRYPQNIFTFLFWKTLFIQFKVLVENIRRKIKQ